MRFLNPSVANLLYISCSFLIISFAVCAVAPFSVTSTEDRTHNLSPGDTPQRGPLPTSAGWKLYVDDSLAGARQVVHGFGAAWTDGAIVCLESLSATQQEQVLSALFGSGADSIQLRLMRHTIGQSDISPPPLGEWSYDSNNGQPDPEMQNFSLTAPGLAMTSWLRRMRAKDDSITLFGSPWSPPQWMKDPATNAVNVQKYADAWARYIVHYVQAFAAEGVRVDALTPQNEPLHSSDPAWTTNINAGDEAVLINMLGPMLQEAAAGLKRGFIHQSVTAPGIWAYDHNTDRPDFPETVLSQAGQHVAAVAWHCYSTVGAWQALSDFHKLHPGVAQYMTECWTHLQDESFFDLSDFVIGPLQNWASGALAWTLVGSAQYDVAYPGGCAPCSGLIQVDRQLGTFELTQDYYSMGQFSKFVDARATYLSTTGSYIYPDGTGVQAVAFRNDDTGERVLVIQNKIRSDLPMQVTLSNASEVWHASLPARSLTTWVLPAV